MIINNHNAPASFLKFCGDDQYSKGDADYSVTELIDEPRIVALSKRYPEMIINDPMENPWMYISSIFHELMESNSPDDEVAEQRLFAEVDGTVISGAMDVQKNSDDGVIIGDYKMTSVMSIKDTSKWEEQLNLSAYLVETCTDKKVVGLQIYAFLRDWKITMSERVRDYPATPGMTIDIKLWDREEREDFAKYRVFLHKKCEEMSDDDLPACSHTGRWPTGTLYSVTNLDDKKISTFDRKRDAEKFVSGLDIDTQFNSFIGTTHKDYRRCKSYCHFNETCNIYKEFMNERKNR